MKVPFPTNATFDFSRAQAGVEYAPYDPRKRIAAEHRDAEVLVAWLNPPAQLEQAAADKAPARATATAWWTRSTSCCPPPTRW